MTVVAWKQRVARRKRVASTAFATLALVSRGAAGGSSLGLAERRA
jgi:hypothetical protein